MECQSCSEALTALLDGELSSDESRRVRDHLSECQGCRTEFESLSFSAQLVDKLSLLKAGEDLWTRIASEIGPAPEPEQRWRLPFLDQFFSRRWVPLSAAGGVLAIVLAVFLTVPVDPIQAQFSDYVAEREVLMEHHRDILFGPSRLFEGRQDRNPFTQPVSMTDPKIFQEHP